MAHFIKLTGYENKWPYYVNVEHIKEFFGFQCGTQIIGLKECWYVEETTEEIIEMIQNEGVEMIGAEICYTPEAVAKFLHVSYSTLHRYEKDGTLVPFKVGKKNRYRKSDILALVSGTPKQDKI